MESAKNSHFILVSKILGVFAMYISSNNDQLTIEDFFMPFGGNLLKTNRWMKLASMMPWEHIEEVYMESVDLEALTIPPKRRNRTPVREALCL